MPICSPLNFFVFFCFGLRWFCFVMDFGRTSCCRCGYRHGNVATVSSESVYFVSPCGGPLSGASCVYVCVLADVNECEDPWACANGGTCYNTEGGYACACTADWTGATCETGGSCCDGFIWKRGWVVLHAVGVAVWQRLGLSLCVVSLCVAGLFRPQITFCWSVELCLQTSTTARAPRA